MKNIFIIVAVLLLVGVVGYFTLISPSPESTLEDNESTIGKDDLTLKNMNHTVTIKTNLGEIKIATYDSEAPKTVDNFITLANKRFYEGVIFHRVMHLVEDDEVELREVGFAREHVVLNCLRG